MATPIDPAEKSAIIAILKEKNCSATRDVFANMNTYDDLVRFFVKYGKAFDGDNAYLNSLFAIPDTAEMNAVGMYFDAAGAVTLTNPKVVAKYTGGVIININTGGIFKDLEIVGASHIQEIIISNNTVIDSLAIVGGSTVDLITIQPGSCINTILIKSENGQNSVLTKIDGTCVKNFGITEDSVFGGYECDPSGGTLCLDEVIGLASSTPTIDGFTVCWTNPINSTGNEVRYRKLGDLPWLVPNALGNATGAFGPGPCFTFHAMATATTYEVRVANSCIMPTTFSAGEITSETTL